MNPSAKTTQAITPPLKYALATLRGKAALAKASTPALRNQPSKPAVPSQANARPRMTRTAAQAAGSAKPAESSESSDSSSSEDEAPPVPLSQKVGDYCLYLGSEMLVMTVLVAGCC